MTENLQFLTRRWQNSASMTEQVKVKILSNNHKTYSELKFEILTLFTYFNMMEKCKTLGAQVV